ncbi:hypothetical protein [Treponema denticola]|uniref:hypothetical protein n=1 Tax=Treponema denticola TaxID=158 RepID=UPI0021059E5A|nr:hypothetical protein [Treponema denticola]UTY25063.1 hypothetical protein E4N78_13715 [Treponema denticola]
MIGALVLIISAVVLITGCSQANSNKGNTGNNRGILEVQPTAEAYSRLKGTTWKSDTPIIFVQFTNQGDIMEIDEYRQALYQVDGLKISFDLSSFLAMKKN